ncbi:hypothetical protein KUTeg_013142 [Tegillarca granosa]|uniref:Uncharacterized protein n=1 Tax=Tegillarca granosa TaxID=220873 RepID=A0ABQ9ESU3_TEGGR|nr:hypothetical protein KUTeg_013142 [Tegillarca granosa]
MSSQSSRLKQVFMDKESVSTKKTVKFTDDHESSGSESDEESDDSDSGDDKERDDDDSQSDEEYEAKNTNRFAYPGDHKKEKTSTKSFISLSPSEYELKMGIKDIISGFENTIGPRNEEDDNIKESGDDTSTE